MVAFSRLYLQDIPFFMISYIHTYIFKTVGNAFKGKRQQVWKASPCGVFCIMISEGLNKRRWLSFLGRSQVENYSFYSSCWTSQRIRFLLHICMSFGDFWLVVPVHFLLEKSFLLRRPDCVFDPQLYQRNFMGKIFQTFFFKILAYSFFFFYFILTIIVFVIGCDFINNSKKYFIGFYFSNCTLLEWKSVFDWIFPVQRKWSWLLHI